jgi:hypothetical protein
VPIAFRIRNAEGADRAYRWRASVVDGGARHVAASGVARLAEGAATTVRVGVPVACEGVRTRVEIALAVPRRTIGFWLSCQGDGA